MEAYDVDLRGLHSRACGMLDELELELEPLYGAVLRSNLDKVLETGALNVREVVGL